MAGLRVRRALARITVAALALATPAVLAAPSASAAAPTDLFFSEYIEGSSNNKALEIYNGTGAAIDLAAGGYSIQQYSNGAATAGLTINLSGTVSAGDVFVFAHSSADQAILAEADQTSGAGLFNGDDALVLRKGATVIDSIGQVGVDPGTEWGSGLTSTADNTLRRLASVCAGDTTIDDPFDPADEWEGFAANTFDGLGAHTATCSDEPPVDTAPSVLFVNPGDGGTGGPNSPVTVTFSEPVDVAEGAFSLTCSSGGVTLTVGGGPTTYTLTPSSALVDGDTCLLSISAAAVTDVDGPADVMSEDFTSTFTVAVTLISEIQGSGVTTELAGQVRTVEAVVTAIKPGLSGFYLQEEDSDADADPTTSEGIFVFGSATVDDVAVGQLVRVTGTVGESQNTGASTQTQLRNATVEVLEETAPLPAVTPVTFPVPSTTYLEQFEGMRVQLVDELVISEYFNYDRFGEVVLAKPLDGQDRLHTPTAVVEPGSEAVALAAEQALRIITLDDYNSSQNPAVIPHPGNGEPFSVDNTFRGGDTVSGVIGVIDHTFGVYRIQPTEYGDYEAVNPRPTDAPDVGGSIQVASFNVLNYFLTLDDGNDICGPDQDQECRGADFQEELNRQRVKILAALEELNADVVGLIEMENTPGVEPAADLVAGLNDLMGPGTYDYIDTGVIGTDAIRLGFIYKPGIVQPVGDHAILDSMVDPRFDDTRNRPMLSQTFDEVATGARVTVSVNHLKSKGSACAGDPDNGDGQGNCNLTRAAAAEAIADFLAEDPTGSGDPDHLIVGDLNAYDHEDPIDALVETGYTDLVKKFGGEFAYGYVFDGKVGYLDHALSNESLTPQVTGASEWHINADEPDVLDYNLDFGKPASSFSPDPYRSSDHDPVLVGLNLNVAPTVEASFGEGFFQCWADDATLTVEITDANEDDTHTVTVDWGDGTEPTIVGTDERTVTLTHTYAAAGTYTATVTVMDSLGEVDQTTVEATVAYATDGIGAPFKNSERTAKDGSTVPVKVELRDCDGSEPTDLDPTITVTQGDAVVLEATMGYVDGNWQYNLRTRDLDGPGQYTVTITVPETGQTVTGSLTVRR